LLPGREVGIGVIFSVGRGLSTMTVGDRVAEAVAVAEKVAVGEGIAVGSWVGKGVVVG